MDVIESNITHALQMQDHKENLKIFYFEENLSADATTITAVKSVTYLRYYINLF